MKFRSLVRKTVDINPRVGLNALLCYASWALRLGRAFHLPVALDIILTKACNLSCVFCISYSNLRGERWMDFGLYRQIARHLFPSAHGVYFCSGGEPFLYPHIREALQLARRYHTRTVISSNGMLLSRETARWLVRDRILNELTISFDGACKETLERLRRGAKFETILDNLAYLDHIKRRNGSRLPDTGFRFVLMRSNAAELPRVVELCAQYGLSRVEATHLKVADNMDPDESLLRHPELCAEVFTAAGRKASELNVTLRLPSLNDRFPIRCKKPWEFCQIDSDGALRHCYYAWRQRLGYFQSGFADVWRGSCYQAIRETVGKEHPYYPFCKMCPEQRGVLQLGRLESLHDRPELLIDGMEELQVDTHTRQRENREAFAQRSEIRAEI